MASTSQSLLNYLRVAAGAWRDDPRDDAALLAQFADCGDEIAFGMLVSRHGPLVWRTCRRMLGDTPDAEDAFQVAFLTLARKADRLRREQLAGWLHRVARQTAMNARSKLRKSQDLERRCRTLSQPEPKDDSSDRAELYAALDEELVGLPERLRVPLLLHYLEGRSQVEVARLLGCARSVLQKRLARGESLLRARLERRGLGVGVVSIGAFLGSTATVSAVPARLIGRTARSALAFRSGALTGGAAEAAREVLGALPSSSLGTMIMRKSLWIVLACCLGLGSATLLTYRSLSAQPDEPGETSPTTSQAPRQPGPGGRAAARVDCYGDPLPAGALARMGTVRQWYGRMEGFTPNPTILAFSPDSKTLVSQKGVGPFYGSNRGAEYVCLWDAATGREIRRITTDTSAYEMTFLALSPDGRTLITGEKGTVYLWEMATGKLLHKLAYQGPKREAFFKGITCLPNGKILTLDSDNRVCLWDVATGGREISQLKGRRKGENINSRTLAFSWDGKMVAATDEGLHSKKIRLWEIATGKKIRQLQLTGKNASVYSVAFSPDGRTLAAGSSGGEPTCVWDVATGKPIHRFKAGGSGFSCPLAYSPDGKTLLGGHEGHLWDITTGKEIRSFGWKDAQIAVFSPNGKILAAVDWAGVIRLWEVATGKEILPHKGHQDRVTFIAYSPDGKILTSVSHDKTVRLWEVATGKEIRQLAKHTDWNWGVGYLAYPPDGKMLAYVDNVMIHLWDTAGGKKIRQLKGARSPESVTFSPDGKILAAPVGTQTVCLWQVATGRQICTIEVRCGRGAEPLVFSPDVRMLAAPGNKDGTVDLWEVATGKFIGPLPLKQDGRIVWSLAFSPDGRILATSSEGEEMEGDKKAYLWEVATGKEICQLNGLKDGWQRGWSLTFSPDDRILATVGRKGGNDEKIHLWEVVSGKEIGQLNGHRSTIRCVAFSPDGKTLASSSDDLACLVWDITPFVGRLKPVPAQTLSKEQLEAVWADLANNDPAKAYAAVHALQALPAQAIPILRERVRPVAPVTDPKQLQRWIADLDANSFTARDRAQREIAKLGEVAVPALRQVLKGQPALEAKRRLQALLDELEPKEGGLVSPRGLGEVRAVQVLESIGTAEAQQVLQAWAKGVTEARLTQEAQAALDRLAKRSAAKP